MSWKGGEGHAKTHGIGGGFWKWSWGQLDFGLESAASGTTALNTSGAGFERQDLSVSQGWSVPNLNKSQGAGPNSDDSDIPGTRVGSVDLKSPITFASELCDLANEQFNGIFHLLLGTTGSAAWSSEAR
jgi:hypothetical protein